MTNDSNQEILSAQAQTGHNNTQDNSSHQTNNYFYGLPTSGKDQAELLENLIKGQAGEGKKNLYNDWHTTLPDRSWGITSFPDSESKIGALKTTGQLLITCGDDAILHDVGTWIGSQTSYGQKLLVCRTNRAFNDERDIDSLAAYVIHLSSWWPEQAASIQGPLLVVFHLEDRLLAGAFMKSLRTLAAFKGSMRRIHLVFLLFAEAREFASENALRGQIEVWRLPAASLLVRQTLGAEAGQPDREIRVREVLKTIEQQRAQRRWATDEAAHAREIRILMERGGDLLDTLEHEVANRAGNAASEDRSSGYVVSVALTEVARRGTVVEKAVLFTSAFCGCCSMHEQNLILESILAGKAFKPQAAKPEALKFRAWRMPGKGRAAKSGEDTAVEGKNPASEDQNVDAFEFWRANDQDVMERCGVVTVTSAEGARQVSFPHEGMTEMVRNTLSDSFVVECFEAVSHRMIFHLDASPSLVDKLVRLAAEMCVRYPDRFGEAWLRDVLNSIQRVWALSIAAEIQNLGIWYQQLRGELKGKGNMLSRLNNRLATLCEAMMQRPASKAIAIQFIDSLLGEGAYGIVIRLAKRLRSIEPESCFKWLKRCLDQGQQEDKSSASEALFVMASVGAIELDEVITHVFAWMPEQGREIGRISQAERFALLFPLLLQSNLEDQSGKLLTQDGSRGSEDRCKLLVRWLCHPKVRELLASDHETASVADEIISYCLLAWVLKLAGHASTLISEFRVQSPPRQTQSTRTFFGKQMGSADRAWMKAAGHSYRNPMDAGSKRDAENSKQTLQLIKSSWRQLGERLPA